MLFSHSRLAANMIVKQAVKRMFGNYREMGFHNLYSSPGMLG